MPAQKDENFNIDVSGRVAGVDEAGRGPLADSKILSASRREELAALIRERALCWALGSAEVEEIDHLNILQASLLAMHRAVAALRIGPDLVLVDGNQAPNLSCRVRTVVRGDATIPAISAASILAKVTRDAEMCRLDTLYPDYGFAMHKGYPTEAHLKALERSGVSPLHRRTFGPVRRLLDRSDWQRNT